MARRAEQRSEGRRNGTSSPPSAATARRCSRSRCSAWPAAADRATARTRRACSPQPPSSAMPGAAYNLALLYLEGQLFPRDFTRAAELFRTAARSRQPGGAIRARDLLQGRPRRAEGPARGRAAARRCCARRNTDAEVEYGIALFNGTGVTKNESAAATYLTRAAQQGQPDRAEPARLHVRHRPRREGRSGAGRDAGT